MHGRKHACCVIGILALFVCVFALSAENNDSRVLFVPKKEFIKVIGDIMSPSGVETDGSKKETGEHVTGIQFTSDQDDADNKQNRVKRDSFYHLQKSLEHRSHALEDSLRHRTVMSSPRINSRFNGEFSDNEYGA